MMKKTAINPANRKNKMFRPGIMPVVLSFLLVMLSSQAVFVHPVLSSGVSQHQDKLAPRAKTPLIKKTVQGVYEGQADGHTVEISVYGEPISIQFKPGLEKAIASIEEGTPVVITYTEQQFVDDPVVLLCNLLAIRELKPWEQTGQRTR